VGFGGIICARVFQYLRTDDYWIHTLLLIIRCRIQKRITTNQNFMKKFLLSALALICQYTAHAQCDSLFSNPSFEGTESDTAPPPAWTPCVHNYQATFPYPIDATLPAFAGHTYLGLRYSDIGGGITQGAVSQQLLTPFTGNGTAYTFTIALADIGLNDIGGDNAQCQIYGGFSACDTHELLWEDTLVILSGINNASEWTQYTFVCHPSEAFTYVTIRVNSESPQAGTSFYIGVDSFARVCPSTTTAIETVKASGISISPNPATNVLTLNSCTNTPYTLRIYDLTGREITSKELVGETSMVDVSQLAKGVYLARVTKGDKSYCQKLVIQ
jgi:hypothetical protein